MLTGRLEPIISRNGGSLTFMTPGVAAMMLAITLLALEQVRGCVILS